MSAFVNSIPLLDSSQSIRVQRSCRGEQKSEPTKPQRRYANVKMQAWSDPAVTREYLDFLSGKEKHKATVDCQSTVVGLGRVGEFLRAQGDGTDLVITRGLEIPPDAPGPVYLCTRNDDLEEIINKCPPEKKEDLVFIQNGMLERFLRRHDCSPNTKANIYFAISKKGQDPIDGITETNPEGLTSVYGKWQDAFAERLHKAGLTCKVMKDRDFRRSQLDKLIWICVTNLVGAVHGNISMGEVANMHVKEVTELSVEMATMLRFTLAVGMMPDIEERILAYASRMKDFPTAIKEFKWRNGFFYDYSMLAKNNSLPDPTPMHT